MTVQSQQIQLSLMKSKSPNPLKHQIGSLMKNGQLTVSWVDSLESAIQASDFRGS